MNKEENVYEGPRCPIFDLEPIDYLEWVSYYATKIKKIGRRFKIDCGNAIVYTDEHFLPTRVHYLNEELVFTLDKKNKIIKIKKYERKK